MIEQLDFSFNCAPQKSASDKRARAALMSAGHNFMNDEEWEADYDPQRSLTP
jgi:hypothetical protein